MDANLNALVGARGQFYCVDYRPPIYVKGVVVGWRTRSGSGAALLVMADNGSVFDVEVTSFQAEPSTVRIP
jgi:hypothetical protein